MALAGQTLLSSCEKEETLFTEESSSLPTELKIITSPVEIKTEIGAIASATVSFGEEVTVIKPSFCISTNHTPTSNGDEKHAVITFEKKPGMLLIMMIGRSYLTTYQNKGSMVTKL